MWVITPDQGFFSAVQKDPTKPNELTIRARAREDLERLTKLPSLRKYRNKIVEGEGTDYGYRIVVTRRRWQKALVVMAQGIDYINFKTAVGLRFSQARASIYSRVWSALYAIQPPGLTKWGDADWGYGDEYDDDYLFDDEELDQQTWESYLEERYGRTDAFTSPEEEDEFFKNGGIEGEVKI